MILRARADRLDLESAENGWALICETDEGDTIVLNIHSCAYDFAGSPAFRELELWRMEGRAARVNALLNSTFVCDVDESGGLADGDA